MKYGLVKHDSMPWVKKSRSRRRSINRYNDVPQFLANIGHAIKEWAQLQGLAVSIQRNAQLLRKAALTKDSVALKVIIQKLRIDMNRVEAMADKAIHG